jgi:hypothetical protein
VDTFTAIGCLQSTVSIVNGGEAIVLLVVAGAFDQPLVRTGTYAGKVCWQAVVGRWWWTCQQVRSKAHCVLVAYGCSSTSCSVCLYLLATFG